MEKEHNTFTGYLGDDFQWKLLWQLVTDSDFGEKIIPFLQIEYFDNAVHKRFFVVLNAYFKNYNKVASLQDKSVDLAIKKFSKSTDPTEFEILTSVADQIKNWNERILNKDIPFNGDVIQKEAFAFIKQQELRKLADLIYLSVKKGEIGNDQQIVDQMKKINEIGNDDDMGIEIMENIERALTPEFRKTIPTGVNIIDDVMNGGLGNGEMGAILAPLGVGKSTILTKIANSACNAGNNVLQIIFEDTEDQIRRKHFAIWSGIPLSEMDKNLDIVERRVHEWYERHKPGKLIIKRFSQENTTMPKIRQFIDRYQKKFGLKFDMVVLDYIDCVESHKSVEDQNSRELVVIKAFEAMANELNIPCWTAIQTNRGGIGAEYVSTDQMGGNIKKAQKTHFLMSVAKTAEQKVDGTANVAILKARMVQDGFIYKDCIFNNDTLEIRRTDPFMPKSVKNSLEKMKITEEDVQKFNENMNRTKEVEQFKAQKDNELDYHSDVKSVTEEAANHNYQEPSSEDLSKKVLKSLTSNDNLDDDGMDFINKQLLQIAQAQDIMKK